MKSHLIKYANGLLGQYYQTPGANKLIVYAAGAPGIPSAMQQEANLFAQHGFDLIRPDYYGHARSDGFFSNKNCIQTIYNTIQIFHDQIPIFSIYTGEEITPPAYQEIVVVGASYGGWIASILPKFDTKIKEIVLLYPSLDRLDRNEHGYKESTDEDFIREYALGYKHIYRFAEGVDPYDAMLDIEPFDSMKDPSHLKDTKVFVGHGGADDVIRAGRSKQFVDQLKDMNPDGNYHYAEYYGLGHGGICKDAILQGWLHWRKQFTTTTN